MDNLILKSFFPELFLSIAILFQLLYNTNKSINVKYNFIFLDKEILSQIYFILFITILLLLNINIEGSFSNFLLINDLAAIKIKIIFIVTVLLSSIFIWQSYTYQNLNFFEFFIILFFVILASLLLISCYDLFSTYLILELQALSFYILAGIKRNSTFSTESALKYFIVGSFFSCIYLFGVSILYCEIGTTNFYTLNLLLALPFSNDFNNINILIHISIITIIITMLFKLALVPFHFWVPDVYDGAPLSSTIIFSVFPKLILFTFLIRFLLISVNINENINFIFYFTGLFSLVIGTFNALKQKRLKKLYIYSSIAQIGFLALALATFSKESISAIFFFLMIYNITGIIGWASLTYIYGFQKQITFFQKNKKFPIFLSDLINIFSKNKSWALAFLIFFFSIAGIPPFVGFWGKFYIFISLILSQNYSFIIFLMIISSISAFYYIRILKLIFFEIKKTNKSNNLFLGNFNFLYKDISSTIFYFCLFLLIYLFFYPEFLILLTKYVTIGFFKL